MRTNGKIQLYPFLRLVLCFIAGIVAGELLYPALGVRFWATLSIVMLVTAAVLARRPLGQSMALWACVTAVGGFRVTLGEVRAGHPIPEEPQAYEAVILSEPMVHGKVVRFDLRICQGVSAGRMVKASLLRDTVAERYRSLHVGDAIRAFSVVQPLQVYCTDSHFDYLRWLRIHGYSGQTFIYYKDWAKTRADTLYLPLGVRLRLGALRFRRQLLSRYYPTGADKDDAYAVLAAMTLGDKSALSGTLKDMYSVTGASHILALSGLHLGILYFLLSTIFLRWRRTALAQLVILVAIWGYAFLVGMMPSVVRAAVMMSVYALVSVVNRKPVSLNTLSLTALVMLSVEPLLLWDVGFQMSFMAVLGIIVYYRPLLSVVRRPWMRRWRLTEWCCSLLVVSVSAQLATAPLVAYYFGRFSCYFLLTNLVAVPLATAIIYGAVVVWMTSPVPVVQSFVVKALFFLARMLNESLAVFSRLPGASIEHIHISAVQLWLVYILEGCLFVLAHYGVKMYKSARSYTLK